ncbi:hypothetical protein [Mycobacterium sp.]|uniref:hypothetical protein n=1 Tax=Mycobacterium sp. TaxID=1785 RepID=UPI002B98276B|nr:hypothetical protein [Mycobacterium sp.]HTQ22385.1 hypothetical protein [Mycobacterium sp.]
MLTIRDHNVEDYTKLRDMDTTDVAVLDDADRACLDELGQYLVATDAWERFSIWLLHKHFEPVDGEVFVESLTAAPRGTETTLAQRCAGFNATSMRFDARVDCGVGGVGVIGVEFADAADFGATASLGADDEDVLAGIAERLRAAGKTERFGVRLIRNPLGISESEVLLETCDVPQRTLRCSVTEREDACAGHNVETSWQWKPNSSGTGPSVMQYCATVCMTDADGHHWNSHV